MPEPPSCPPAHASICSRDVIVEASADAVVIVSRDGRIAFMNESGRRALDTDALGARRDAEWASLWPETDRPKARLALDEALHGGFGRFQARCPAAKGTATCWDVLVSPVLDTAGGVESLLAVCRDVTEFKRVQDQLNAALAQADADTQARNAFLTQFGAEIRAAVANMLGFAGLLGRARHFDPENRDHLQRIARVGAGLLSLLNDFLDPSRGTAKKAETTSMDVDRFMAAIVDLSAARAAAKALASSDGRGSATPVLFELDEQTRIILRLFKGAA